MTDQISQVFAQAVSVSRAFPIYNSKTSDKDSSTKVVNVIVNYVNERNPVSDWSTRLQEITEVAASVRLCAHLVDRPPNDLNCKTYVELVSAVKSLY